MHTKSFTFSLPKSSYITHQNLGNIYTEIPLGANESMQVTKQLLVAEPERNGEVDELNDRVTPFGNASAWSTSAEARISFDKGTFHVDLIASIGDLCIPSAPCCCLGRRILFGSHQLTREEGSSSQSCRGSDKERYR